MRIEVGGFLGLVLLVADVYAVVHIASSRAGTGAKVAWIVFILLLPLLGFLVWLVFGPRSANR